MLSGRQSFHPEATPFLRVHRTHPSSSTPHSCPLSLGTRSPPQLAGDKTEMKAGLPSTLGGTHISQIPGDGAECARGRREEGNPQPALTHTEALRNPHSNTVETEQWQREGWACLSPRKMGAGADNPGVPGLALIGQRDPVTSHLY